MHHLSYSFHNPFLPLLAWFLILSTYCCYTYCCFTYTSCYPTTATAAAAAAWSRRNSCFGSSSNHITGIPSRRLAPLLVLCPHSSSSCGSSPLERRRKNRRQLSFLSATTADSSSSSSSSSFSSQIQTHSNLLWNCTALHTTDDNNNSNNTSTPPTTSTTFYALRHGHSLANQAGIIASNPATACTQYGLSSDKGFPQAVAAGNEIWNTARQQQQKQPQKVIIVQLVSSDFKRAVETAETVRKTLLLLQQQQQTMDDDDASTSTIQIQIPPIVFDTRLRERDFGDWDGTSDDNYEAVWKDDAVNASHTVCGVESVNAVMRRSTACVLDYWMNTLSKKNPVDVEKDNSNSSSNITRHGGGTKTATTTTTMIVLVAHGDVLQILQTAFLKRDGKYHRSVEHLETAQLRKLELH